MAVCAEPRNFCLGHGLTRHRKRNLSRKLSGMSFTHLEGLRLLNSRVAFDTLLSTQPEQEYLQRLRILNAACRSSFLQPYQFQRFEEEFVEAVESFARRTLRVRNRQEGARRLIWAVENLLYLMERSEHYEPSDEAVERLLSLVPAELRLESRLPQWSA